MYTYLKKLYSIMIDASKITLADVGAFQRYLAAVPFNVICNGLYSARDLYDVFDPQKPESFDCCYDTRVYRHMVKTGKMTTNPIEMVARAMHDCEMRRHMQAFLERYEPCQVVGIMGGHAMRRTDDSYRLAVEVSKQLTEKGYLMISGGGPGAMEATHLGAWMAGRSIFDVDRALEMLSKAPSFKDEGWLATALEVMKRFPRVANYKSLAIPTWFYGHEPPCAFATHIAKFFDNSVREDTIVTVAYGGLIYMPGSAGTVQEIFQEAVQDHYLSNGYASPMVFVGKDYWTNEVPVYPFFSHMVEKGHYKNMLLWLVDETEDIVSAIDDFESIYDALPGECKQR